MSQTLRDLLAAGRISNLPTVWSNVFCGFLVTAHHLKLEINSIDWKRLVIGGLTGSFLYIAGCFYNDYHDQAWDASHKAERALPSGRLSPSILLFLIIISTALGIAGSYILGSTAVLTTVLLLFFIWIYTLTHKKTIWGILPMGLCRACLYFLGFACVNDLPVNTPPKELYSFLNNNGLLSVAPIGIGILLYIAGITAVARNEAKNTLSPVIKWVGIGCLLAPVFTHFHFSTEGISYLALVMFTLSFLTARSALIKKQLGKFVSISLAGLCLVDGLAYLSLPHPRPLNIILGFAVMVGLYISSRLLQRIAPAT